MPLLPLSRLVRENVRDIAAVQGQASSLYSYIHISFPSLITQHAAHLICVNGVIFSGHLYTAQSRTHLPSFNLATCTCPVLWNSVRTVLCSRLDPGVSVIHSCSFMLLCVVCNADHQKGTFLHIITQSCLTISRLEDGTYGPTVEYCDDSPLQSWVLRNYTTLEVVRKVYYSATDYFL